jgi:Mlc titration factor MtfA (ptsG expression regulator)
LRRLLRRFFGAPTLDPHLWQRACASLPFVTALDVEREQRLAALAARFLHEKAITPIGEFDLDDAQRVQLAALCCLPLLEFGAEGLHGWSQLLVYPDAFRVNRTHIDAAGVLHEWDDELIGEAWETGPVILSWADVQADLAAPRDGFCVAVHEIAHKLDALDGALDGTPPLPRAWQKQWAHDFEQAFEHLGRQVDARRTTIIDGYAAEAPEEFFAVCTEYHFSAPDLLHRAYPKVASHLIRFYGPSPMA